MHLTIEFTSQVLNMGMRLEAVLPDFEAGRGRKDYPLLLLLHGMTGCENDYIRLTALEKYARKHEIAIVMPATHMGAYTNQYAGSRYFDYVAKELPEVCAAYLPVCTDREHTWLAGLSMGGYGALKTALNYPERFSRVAVMSAGCDRTALLPKECADIATLEELHEKRETLTDRQFQSMQQFLSTFGSRARFAKDEVNNLFLLAEKKAKEPNLPAICLWCGAEDMLAIDPNRRFHTHLTKLGVDHEFIEDHGVHDWDYWDSHLPPLLSWLDK